MTIAVARSFRLPERWRVSSFKDFPGAARLREAREGEARRRLTTVVGGEAFAVGAQVSCEGSAIGELVNAGYSALRGEWVGLALLDSRYAYPGIDEYMAGAGEEAAPVRTVSPPVLNNRSIFVDPQKHSYRTRESDVFPPLVEGTGESEVRR